MDIFNYCGLEPSRNCVAAFSETNSAGLAGEGGWWRGEVGGVMVFVYV